jgi:hypothetical protein
MRYLNRLSTRWSVLVLIVAVSVSCADQSAVSGEKHPLSYPEETPLGKIGTVNPPIAWQPAVFRGVVFGTTKLEELERIMGKPDGQANVTDEETSIRWIIRVYNISEPFHGRMRFEIDENTSIVERADLGDITVTSKDVIKVFGEECSIGRYEFDVCLSSFDSAPIYETESGSLKYIEYRSKGIAFPLDSDEDTVSFILFLNRPLGSTKSKCGYN